MVALSLCCFVPTFSGCGEWGLLSSFGPRASYCSGFSSCGAQALGAQASVLTACWLQKLQHMGSVLLVHRLWCSAACGIFPEQGLNPRPLHWQADSYPLYYQGSSCLWFFIIMNNAAVNIHYVLISFRQVYGRGQKVVKVLIPPGLSFLAISC